jgi:glycosyltransferase involved in cell wall biosynthesis
MWQQAIKTDMKILCISTSIIPAPTAHSMQLMKVCQALGQLGHQVELIVPGKAGEAWEVLANHYGLTRPLRITYFNSRPGLRRYDFSLTAFNYARRQKPDLIYTWLLPVAVMALWADIPTVLELHGQITGRGAPWFFKQFISSKTSKRLAVITDALKKKLDQQFPQYKDNADTVIAPNGVELERYNHLPSAPVARKRLGLPDRLTVVYTGGFYVGRGIELLHRLARQNPEIQFIWAGGTPHSVDEWQQVLNDEGLDNVCLTGFIDNMNIPLYQAAADILAMPFSTMIAGSSGGNSVEICSPMKMFDYLASGRAIMASDLPVLHEILHNDNALLLPPDDFEAWYKGLARLVADHRLRQALGDKARKDASQYSWLKRESAILKGFPA